MHKTIVNRLIIVSALLLASVVTARYLPAQQVRSHSPNSSESFQQLKVEGLSRSRYRSKSPENPSVLKSDLKTYKKVIQPILSKSCLDCHGPDLKEGNIRIDTLDPNLSSGDDVDWWLEVFAVLANGEMPPPGDAEMSDEDRGRVIDWLAQEIQVASAARRASANHTSFRRMTRYEFNYAVQDLLGLNRNFAKDLPPEPVSPDGFQNSSEMLHMSVTQLETYRELSRKALQRATVEKSKPRVLYWGITMKDAGRVDWSKQEEELAKIERQNKDDPEKLRRIVKQKSSIDSSEARKPHFRDLSNGRSTLATWNYRKGMHANLPSKIRPPIPDRLDDVAIIPSGGNQRLTIELGDQVPDEGIMRVRVRAARTSSDPHKVPSLQITFGWQASNEGRSEIPVAQSTPVEASVDRPRFYQWDIPLGDIYPRNSVRGRSTMGAMPNPSEYIRLVNRSISGDAIQIDYVEVMTPVFDQWPPSSHRKIFFPSKHSQDELKYAREVLASFMTKAWRRTISEAEISRKVRLFAQIRNRCDSFEEAMVEVLATVLGSPHFLYLTRKASKRAGKTKGPSPLTPEELASRLSIFLWSSIPDDRLLELAKRGKLQDPSVLSDEVDRMLRDPKAKRFSAHFVQQWLHLQILDFLDLKQHFPQFANKGLKDSMRQEPIEFFQHLLNHNGSVLDFLHSDYAVIDERLAAHYGIRNVFGNEFRKVKLSPGHQRGGLLTQAAMLTMNSDGIDSHPLKRGIWLLECVLNDPPPPPPPNVPEIDLADPDIAKMTLKERLEHHRNHAACRSCHSKIDPWGIAFENYDAVGRWRQSIKGKPVDATSKLFNQQKLAGVEGLKIFLLKNRQDQFVRAMVYKMTTYAMGRPLTFADRSSVDKITREVRHHEDKLATMIQLITKSELFQSK